MRLLRRLLSRGAGDQDDDSRLLVEWLGKDEDAVQLGRVEHFDVFLEDLREVAPHGSTLVLEGKPTSDVRDFLVRVRIDPDVRTARNTIWPKQDFFHILATRENIDQQS